MFFIALLTSVAISSTSLTARYNYFIECPKGLHINDTTTKLLHNYDAIRSQSHNIDKNKYDIFLRPMNRLTRASRRQSVPLAGCARPSEEFLITHTKQDAREVENVELFVDIKLEPRQSNYFELQLKLCDILFDASAAAEAKQICLIELFLCFTSRADAICCIVSETNFYYII